MDALRVSFLFLLVVVAIVHGAPQPETPTKCPKEDERRYLKSNECFKLRKKNYGNPCPGDNMVFLEVDDVDGICECDPDLEKEKNRRFLYWPETESCFGMHSQGPCGSEEWIGYSSDGTVECQPNKCPEKNIEEHLYFVWPDEHCYRHRVTGCKRTCPSEEECPFDENCAPCPEDYFLGITRNATYPSCISSLRQGAQQSVTDPNKIQCSPGQTGDQVGKCVVQVKTPTPENMCNDGLKWHPPQKMCVPKKKSNK